MHEAPGKPDPTGLYKVIEMLEAGGHDPVPVLYVGDTVADMQTIVKARQQCPDRRWIAVGVCPPHVGAQASDYRDRYQQQLLSAGATTVLNTVSALSPQRLADLIKQP